MSEEEVRSAFQAIAERMWQDVATQPWTDPGYVSNEEAMRLAKQHFVNATAIDLVAIHNNIVEQSKEAK
jgi:hypothetical protein